MFKPPYLVRFSAQTSRSGRLSPDDSNPDELVVLDVDSPETVVDVPAAHGRRPELDKTSAQVGHQVVNREVPRFTRRQLADVLPELEGAGNVELDFVQRHVAGVGDGELEEGDRTDLHRGRGGDDEIDGGMNDVDLGDGGVFDPSALVLPDAGRDHKERIGVGPFDPVPKHVDAERADVDDPGLADREGADVLAVVGESLPNPDSAEVDVADIGDPDRGDDLLTRRQL